MTDASWELFDALRAQLEAQGQRIGELETRVESLLRQSAAGGREAQVFGERPVLRVVEPDQSHLCTLCDTYHSWELPCPVTPAQANGRAQ